jgi:ubiquinone/menaquinone biosynthesis C-methylase UbiE
VADTRRVYYDHEPAYRRIKAKGGRGWDDLFDGEQGSYLSVHAFLAAEPGGGAALEIGCGGGQVSLDLARAGFRTTGLDFAQTAIELARRNASDAGVEVAFVVGDALALPFPDASFELAVDNHLLHCIVDAPDRARVLAEIRRVLVPGGRLWSETMSREGAFDATRYDVDPDTCIARNHSRIWVSRAQLERELAAAGFAVVSMRDRPDDNGNDLVTICVAT